MSETCLSLFSQFKIKIDTRENSCFRESSFFYTTLARLYDWSSKIHTFSLIKLTQITRNNSVSGKGD